jgi:hypothetical protein
VRLVLSAHLNIQLFHTPAGGSLLDLDGSNSYGWENVRRLSTYGKGDRNAESVAYFGLGMLDPRVKEEILALISTFTRCLNH